MVAVARGFAKRGIDVVTFDFPYMRQKRRMPDRAPVLEQAFRDAVATASAWRPDATLFIGGKSMGGRMATHLGAGGLGSLAGLVVFGYPLHPPGKPDTLRTGHLAAITTPLLIIQGERDTFGTPAELRPAVEAMSAPVEVHVVSGGDHSLAVKGRPRDDVLAEVLDVACAWIRTHV